MAGVEVGGARVRRVGSVGGLGGLARAALAEDEDALERGQGALELDAALVTRPEVAHGGTQAERVATGADDDDIGGEHGLAAEGGVRGLARVVAKASVGRPGAGVEGEA